MLIHQIGFALLLLVSPSTSFAFPAPEAMGAISFALSSVWAHLSAIFGSLIGIRSGSRESQESFKKVLIMTLSLLALSIAINIGQSLLSSNHTAMLNEVNFQKVQPVPYPEVNRTFHPNEEHYSVSPETYLEDLDGYQLIPVVTQREHDAEMLQRFDDESPVLVLNSQGFITQRPNLSNNKIPVLADWNNDLSRIAINDLLSQDDAIEFQWLEGGYNELIELLASKKEVHHLIGSSELSSFEASQSPLFIDVSERHAYQERGYYYSAINVPYSAFLSGDMTLSEITQHDGPVVFLDFYQEKSSAVAHWYYLKTGEKAYVLDGGYEDLTKQKLDWVPYYPNRYRLLSPSQIYDWYIGTEDVVFLDGRSKEQYNNSDESWLTISTPVEYTDLEDLYQKVDGLDKSKRYAGFVYDQGNAFKMLVLGHALHERGYTWLGLFTRPQVLSYAEIDDFSKNRPHRIRWWQDYVALTEAYPKALSALYSAMDIPAWLSLFAYGFLFRILLVPITLWTSQPVFMRSPLKSSTKLVANIGFVSVLIVFAMMLQKWIYDFGDLHWASFPYTGEALTDQSLVITLLTTGLIAVQLSVTPGLRLLHSIRRFAFGVVSLCVIGYFLSGLAGGLLIYVSGITLASVLLSVSEFFIRRCKGPTHSEDLPLLRGSGESHSLLCASEVTERTHGIKAGRLGEAYREGFPVPLFFVLNQEAVETLSSPRNQKLLYKAAQRIGDKVIVRSAALTEDASAAKIGRLTSQSVVVGDMTPAGLASFVASVLDSQSDLDPENRQVIVQRYINANHYAVGVSRDIGDTESSRIEYGNHESVTEGRFVKAYCLTDNTLDDGPFSKMHRYLRDLELLYGQAVDAECAQDASAIWILQVRPHHPFYFCEPAYAEKLENKLRGIDETTTLNLIVEAGDEPSPLSISILQELYGDSMVTVKGRPYLIERDRKRKLLTLKQFIRSMVETSNEVRAIYETVCLLYTADLSEDVLLRHYTHLIDLLRTTMDLSIQVRLSPALKKKLSQDDYRTLGYWGEDQKNLTRAYHHPSVFLGASDFDVRKEPIRFSQGFRKDIPALSSKLNKATRVMTDLHYLSARLYAALSILVHEIDRRIQTHTQAAPGTVYGALSEELRLQQWDNPALWQSRKSALKSLQGSLSTDLSPVYGERLTEPFETTIYVLPPGHDVSNIPDGSFLVTDQGRSDIIQKLESISGILCQSGGENSHWMMVARSLNVYAVAGDRSLKIDEWEHGCPVTILTF